jgi:hypothetical protein
MKIMQCWDDGVINDAPLADLLRKYHAKATFNINPGRNDRQTRRFKNWRHRDFHVGLLSLDEMKEVYRNGTAVIRSAQTGGRGRARSGEFLALLWVLFDIGPDSVMPVAFLAQALRDGKGGACAAAVADIAAYMQQTGGAMPCGDTGDYCQARAKLNPHALRRLVAQSAEQLEQEADPAWDIKAAGQALRVTCPGHPNVIHR